MDLSSDKQEVLESIALGSAYTITGSAGTGKTTLGCLIGSKILSLIQPWQKVLYITYSKLARRQINDSIRKLSSMGMIDQTANSRLLVYNYHALWWELINSKKAFLGIPEPVILNTKELERWSLAAVEALYKQTQIPSKFLTKSGSIRSNKLRPLTSLLNGQGLVYQNWGAENFGREGEDFVGEIAFLDEVAKKIIERNQSGEFSHDETVFWAKVLFTLHPNALTTFRLEYPVVILDEFQDTDIAQWELTKLLQPTTLIAMGDTAQTIHKWRGADVNRLQHFEAYSRSGPYKSHHTYDLITRHRANRDMSHHSNIDWIPVSPTISDNFTFNLVKKNVLTKVKSIILRGLQNDLSIGILCLNNDLTNDIVSKVRQTTDFKSGRSIPPLQCIRIGANHSPFEKARTISHDLLCNSPQESDIANSLIKDVFFPCEIDDCSSRSKKDNLRTRWAKATEIVGLPVEGPSAKLSKFVDLCNLEAACTEMKPDKTTLKCLSFIATHIAKLGDSIQNYKDKRLTIDKLVLQFENISTDVSQGSRVSLMTIHQSKGREFDLVIIPWFSTRQWGYRGDGFWDMGDEEHINLFHTACTRAKKQVIVLYPENGCALHKLNTNASATE